MRRTLVFMFVFALAACANDSELTRLTTAKEDFNAATQRVVSYELQAECTTVATPDCRDQAVVELLVSDVNSCNTTIESGGDSVAVRACTTKLENDLSINKIK